MNIFVLTLKTIYYLCNNLLAQYHIKNFLHLYYFRYLLTAFLFVCLLFIYCSICDLYSPHLHKPFQELQNDAAAGWYRCTLFPLTR